MEKPDVTQEELYSWYNTPVSELMDQVRQAQLDEIAKTMVEGIATREAKTVSSEKLAPIAYYGRKKPIVDKQERRAKSKNARKSRRKNRA